MKTYAEFLADKAQLADSGGIEPTNLPEHLFDYQRILVSGRYAKVGAASSPTVD